MDEYLKWLSGKGFKIFYPKFLKSLTQKAFRGSSSLNRPVPNGVMFWPRRFWFYSLPIAIGLTQKS